VFDIGTSQVAKIGDRAREITWAIFDDAVYYYVRRDSVFRWDAKSGETRRIDCLDINFSPDGEYYLRTPRGEESFTPELYRTLDNQEVSPFVPADAGELVGWISHRGHMLLLTKVDGAPVVAGERRLRGVTPPDPRRVMNSAYDPKRRKTVKSFDGVLSTWTGDGSHVLVERDGKVVLEEIP
jgi:hypothetical protein